MINHSRMTLSWYTVIIFDIRVRRNSWHPLGSEGFSDLQPEYVTPPEVRKEAHSCMQGADVQKKWCIHFRVWAACQ